MGFTFNVYLPFPAPENFTATLQDGGNLSANTTYYYRVMAMHTRNGWKRQEGLPSAEISVTTTSTQRTVQLSWSAVNGAYGYAIFRRPASQPHYDGYYYWIPAGSDIFTGYTTTSTSYTDAGTVSLYSSYPLCLYGYQSTYPLPFFDATLFPIQPAARAWVEVIADSTGGTLTLDDIVNAVGTNYCRRFGNTFYLLGSLYLKDSGPLTLSLRGYTLHIAGRLWPELSNASSAITLTDCALWEYGHDFLRPYAKRMYLTRTKWITPGRFGSWINTRVISPFWPTLQMSYGFSSTDADLSTLAPSLAVDASGSITNTLFQTIDSSDIYITTLDISTTVDNPAVKNNQTGCMRVTAGAKLYDWSASKVVLVHNGNTYLVSFRRRDGVNDVPTTTRYNTETTGTIKYLYRLNLKVVDDDGVPISGATVELYNNAGAWAEMYDANWNTTTSLTTASDGTIPEQRVLAVEYYTVNNVWTRFNRSPHTLKVSKSGYFAETVPVNFIAQDQNLTVMLKRQEFVEVQAICGAVSSGAAIAGIVEPGVQIVGEVTSG